MRETMRSGPSVRRGMHPAREDAQPTFDDFSEKADSERDLASDRALSHDVETNPRVPEKSRSTAHDDDPFGDEENSEVKYRTLTWW